MPAHETAAGPPVRVEQRPDGTALVTLNRPDRRNAMTAEVTREWAVAIDGLRRDPGLRCVVVTGAGSAFCAGGDLGWIAESPELDVGEVRERMLRFYREWLSIRELPVPTVAAINGPAIGAGLCLALACDLRYAARRAVFGAPFTALGMHPGMAASWLLPEAVGVSRARELLFTGRRVAAEEAARLGLVHAVVDDDGLLDAALEVAGTISAAAPLATRLTKEALAQGGHRSFAEALAWEGLAQPVTLVSEDLREGVAAQRERRAPRFTGH